LGVLPFTDPPKIVCYLACILLYGQGSNNQAADPYEQQNHYQESEHIHGASPPREITIGSSDQLV
jgi:hypothetical protein